MRQEARVGGLVRCAALCRRPCRHRSSSEVDAALNFRACAVLQAVVRCRVIMHMGSIIFRLGLFTEPFPCAVFESMANSTTMPVSGFKFTKQSPMRGACVSFWLHRPRSISRGCVPDMIEEIAPLLLYPLRMLGTGHCCKTAALERSPCRPRDGLGESNLHRLDLRLHRPSIPSSLFVPQVSLSPHLKPATANLRIVPSRPLELSRQQRTRRLASRALARDHKSPDT